MSEDGKLPRLFVGDHVVDRDDGDEKTLVVVATPLLTAEQTEIKDGDTVADYNAGYPADDAVIKVAFPMRDGMTLNPDDSWSYPRSRLRREAAVHDVGEEKVPVDELRDLVDDWNDLRLDLVESDGRRNQGMAEGTRSAASELKQLIECYEEGDQ